MEKFIISNERLEVEFSGKWNLLVCGDREIYATRKGIHIEGDNIIFELRKPVYKDTIPSIMLQSLLNTLRDLGYEDQAAVVQFGGQDDCDLVQYLKEFSHWEVVKREVFPRNDCKFYYIDAPIGIGTTPPSKILDARKLESGESGVGDGTIVFCKGEGNGA